jgi:multiple sugar transport system permease protein
VVKYGDTTLAIQEEAYAAMTGKKPADQALKDLQSKLESITGMLWWGRAGVSSPGPAPARQGGPPMTTTSVATPTRTKRKPAGRAPGRRAGVGRLAAYLVSPSLLVLGLVIGYPIVSALRLSFIKSVEGIDPNTGLITRKSALSLENYTNIFKGETGHVFWNAFWNTTTFTVVTVVIETVIGICMALIMNKAFRGRGLVRASILVPWAIPTAISALLWRWIFAADGVANDILHANVLWTTEGFQAWLAVVIADTWKTAPFIGLLVLAGMQMIPADVYEAAKVDGASAWRTFWRITLPLVKPALVVAVLFRMLDVLRMFDLPFVLIGPHKASVETLSILSWYEMNNLRFGPAAAYSTVLFVYVAIVAYVFVRVLGADIVGRGIERSR